MMYAVERRPQVETRDSIQTLYSKKTIRVGDYVRGMEDSPLAQMGFAGTVLRIAKEDHLGRPTVDWYLILDSGEAVNVYNIMTVEVTPAE